MQHRSRCGDALVAAPVIPMEAAGAVLPLCFYTFCQRPCGGKGSWKQVLRDFFIREPMAPGWAGRRGLCALTEWVKPALSIRARVRKLAGSPCTFLLL